MTHSLAARSHSPERAPCSRKLLVILIVGLWAEPADHGREIDHPGRAHTSRQLRLTNRPAVGSVDYPDRPTLGRGVVPGSETARRGLSSTGQHRPLKVEPGEVFTEAIRVVG
jgi:hypothetical protein